MGTHVKGVKYVETVDIVSVCDTLIENARETAEILKNETGITPTVYTNWRDMVNEVDAVMIALPHDLHFECGMFFALHNKHILMEKPLCNTEEECLRLIEECEKRNLKLMCAYPWRYNPAMLKFKEYVDSGEYGEIIQFSAWTEQLTGANVDYLDPLNRHWQLTGRLGGGQLFSHGCHYIDLFLWFLGEPITGAHVGTRNGTPWMVREGTSAVIMKFANGAVGYHGATWGARGTRLAYDFQVQTEKGMLEFENNSGEIRLYNGSGEHVPHGGNESQKYTVLWQRPFDNGKNTQYEIKHFAECVMEDKQPETHGRNALQSLRVIWALYDAEKHGAMADLRGLGFEE